MFDVVVDAEGSRHHPDLDMHILLVEVGAKPHRWILLHLHSASAVNEAPKSRARTVMLYFVRSWTPKPALAYFNFMKSILQLASHEKTDKKFI